VLGFDPVDHRLVLATEGPAGRSVTVASKRPRAPGFGSSRSWAFGAAVRGEVVPTSVSVYAGRVVVAGDRPGATRRPPVLVVGATRGGPGTVVRIRGSVSVDRLPVVAAQSRRRVLVGWTRAVTTLDEQQQGAWTTWLRRTPGGRWVTASPVRRSASGFDWLEAVVAGGDEPVQLLVRRDGASRFEPGNPYG
jgi:hypothetical protein